MNRYLLDANVLIAAKNLHYGFDFCPAFWQWIDEKHTAEQVFSIKKIADELKVQDDELSNWAKNIIPNGFFLSVEAAEVTALRRVSQWIQEQRYERTAINAFLQSADYYLIAQALANDAIVVTHEVVSTSTKKVKIPDVCTGMQIKYKTPYEMLRNEKAKFVLESRLT